MTPLQAKRRVSRELDRALGVPNKYVRPHDRARPYDVWANHARQPVPAKKTTYELEGAQ